MCGIIGFVSYKKEESLIRELTDSIAHRGPDEADFTIFQKDNYYVHFGSSRLSIVGEKAGKMPMNDTSGNLLVYNGELYDLQKTRLKIDKDLATTSDTVHLFEYLKQNSNDNLSDLNGMFAFSFYDSKDNSVLLCRDKLGIKPLYYMETDRYPLVFSSEIKPLLLSGFSDKKISKKSLENYLLFGGNNYFSNLLTDIKSLEPGCYFKWSINNSSLDKYYNISKKSGENINLEDLLSTVIDDQLKADVSVDLLLSGGIDSSIIAYIAKSILGKDVKAFSLSFQNKRFDESHKSVKIAEDLNLEHEIIEFSEEQNYEVIDELMYKLPEPIGDPSIVPTYYLNKIVSQHTKAVLTGDGADELFGGYDWYRAQKISPYINSSLESLFVAFAKIVDTLVSDKNIPISDKVELFFSGQKYAKGEEVLHWQNTFASLIDSHSIFTKYLGKLDLSSAKNRYDVTQLIDLQTYLYTNILKKSDTASMLNGLEARPVYLDDRILDYSLSKNQKENTDLLKSKKELRKVAARFTNIHNQKKQGFSHDFSLWVNNIGIPFLNSIDDDHEVVANFLNSIDSKDNFSSIDERNIWRLFSFYKWIDINGVKLIN
jgi:asparagine synthase (glutamine-hydrolysing)